MFFSLGFLVAALGALALAPAFWHRAIRLSTRRLEMQLPLSAREVLAERDLLRAALAVEQRKLEQKVEALGALRAHDMAELGRRAVAVAGKDAELEALHQRLAVRDTENAELRRFLAEATDALDATTAALHDANARWDRSEAELRELRDELEVTRKLCADQAETLADLESKLVHEHDSQAFDTAGKVRLADELSGLRLEHGAALARLNAATAEIFDEGLRRGAPHARKAASLAADQSFRRDIERLVADLAVYRDSDDPGAGSSESGPAFGRSPTEARASLRKRISEIGERAVRLSGATTSALAQRDASHGPARIATKESEG